MTDTIEQNTPDLPLVSAQDDSAATHPGMKQHAAPVDAQDGGNEHFSGFIQEGPFIPNGDQSKSDAAIADLLDNAIRHMLEPDDLKDKIGYRKTIRIMRRAEIRLRQIASSHTQPDLSPPDHTQIDGVFFCKGCGCPTREKGWRWDKYIACCPERDPVFRYFSGAPSGAEVYRSIRDAILKLPRRSFTYNLVEGEVTDMLVRLDHVIELLDEAIHEDAPAPEPRKTLSDEDIIKLAIDFGCGSIPWVGTLEDQCDAYTRKRTAGLIAFARAVLKSAPTMPAELNDINVVELGENGGNAPFYTALDAATRLPSLVDALIWLERAEEDAKEINASGTKKLLRIYKTIRSALKVHEAAPTDADKQAALIWFNRANWNERTPEVKTIRAALQTPPVMPAQAGIRPLNSSEGDA